MTYQPNPMREARAQGYDYGSNHSYSETVKANPYHDDRCRLAWNRGAYQAYQDSSIPQKD